MYKIYINEKALILCSTEELKEISKTNARIVSKYFGKKKYLLNYIDMLEKGSNFSSVIIHSNDFEQLKKDFKSLYIRSRAGGGVIVNEKDEILFIHRRGFWDLPKGKIEKEETIKECAIREVKEETGIKKVKVISRLTVTRHQYKQKGVRFLKFVRWYIMESKSQELIPQVEEDIERASWMTLEKFYSKPRKVYKNIIDVLDAYEKALTTTL